MSKSYLLLTTNKMRGFSLLEVLCALAISVSMVGWTIHGLHVFWRHKKMLIYQAAIYNAIHYARQYALLAHSLVIYCPSANHKTCHGSWQQGQIIKELTSNHIIKNYAALASGFHLQWKGHVTSTTGLLFEPDGTTKGQQGRFVLSDGQETMVLIVTHQGRVRVELLEKSA